MSRNTAIRVPCIMRARDDFSGSAQLRPDPQVCHAGVHLRVIESSCSSSSSDFLGRGGAGTPPAVRRLGVFLCSPPERGIAGRRLTAGRG
jgi:hypothetical protein